MSCLIEKGMNRESHALMSPQERAPCLGLCITAKKLMYKTLWALVKPVCKWFPVR